MTSVTVGFLPEPLMLAVDSLLPSLSVDPKVLSSRKFQQIRESIADLGLVEPLSVTSADRETGQHLVLDGHLRLLAAKELGQTEVACLVEGRRAGTREHPEA